MNRAIRLLLARSMLGLISLSTIVVTPCDAAPGPPVRQVITTETRRGMLGLWWSDRLDGGESADPEVYLFGDDGAVTPLEVPERVAASIGGLLALDGQLVDVAVSRGARREKSAGESRLEVESLTRAPGEGGPLPVGRRGRTGVLRWLTVLLSFPDVRPDPKSADYIRGLMSRDAEPGIGHFFNELSYGALEISGDDVVGSYKLPRPRSYYLFVHGTEGVERLDVPRVLADAPPLADQAVDLSLYAGINFVFGSPLAGAAYGGRYVLSIDGVRRSFGATFLGPVAVGNQGIVAHEMGHALGLPHSSGPYNETYDSGWDLMSNATPCNPSGPVYGCPGTHTIAVHKDVLGWIPAGRRFDAPANASRSVDVDYLDSPASGSNYLLALVPVDVLRGEYYSVEARRRAGYDVQTPGEGIVLHRVNLNNLVPATVVDDTDDNDPNDEGAIWLPGERFVDRAAGVTISVDSATGTGYRVTIERTGDGGGTCVDSEVPAERWKGEYFRALLFGAYGLPVMVRDDGAGDLDFAWPNAQNPSPGCRMEGDLFSVRWTRRVTLEGGAHRFTALTDDGYQLFVDGALVADHSNYQTATEYRDEVGLRAGEHDVEVRYFEGSGDAVFRLSIDKVAGFALMAPAGGVEVRRGGTVEVPVSILRLDGTAAPITLTAAKVKKVKISPPSSGPTTGDSATFTITTTAKSVIGTHGVVFTGRDSAGRVQTARVSLKITE